MKNKNQKIKIGIKTTDYLSRITLIVIFVFSFVFIPVQAKAISAGNLVAMTNQARAQAGLNQLLVNSTLVSAAQMKGQDMIAKDYWAHTSPDGLTPWYWMKQAGYNYSYAGENLAVDFSDDSSLFSAWMASSSHRQNILDPRYTEIGIAAVAGNFQGHDSIVVVQMFGAKNTANPRNAVIAGHQTQINNQTNQIPKEPEKVNPPEYIEKTQNSKLKTQNNHQSNLLDKIKITISDLKKPEIIVAMAMFSPPLATLPYVI